MYPTFILVLLLLVLVSLWWQCSKLVRALVAAALHAGAEMPPPLEAGAPLEHSVQETGTLILVQARIAADADYLGAELQPVQETLQGFLLEDVLQQGVGGLGTQESLYQRNLPAAMVVGLCMYI